MASIGVIGSGTWGTALSILLAGNGHQVDLWSALESEVAALSRTRIHPNLPKARIPDSIRVTGNLKEAMEDKDLLVLSVPSVFVRQTAGRMREFLKPGQVVVNVAKGIEEGSLMTLSQVIEEELPDCQVAALSGPSHAEEVSQGLPTTCVAGAHKRHVAELVQSVFMSGVFRVYTNPDLLGIELGGALKNVIALAAGIADGLGFGDNTKAALITRGIAEISRLGMAMGGKAETFAGLTGIGDLIVTCASMHSRNRRAGILIGQGLSMEEAMKEVHMVVEGVYSAKAARALAEKYQVSMPIVEQVNQVLFEGQPAKEAVTGLMLRDKCTENPSMEWEEG
ncbi:MAG TPA: NAD(P)-dependent glycerol-3-phosphate dehydrogenase [Candidatus Enterocloster faecavium]|uniref:Glycerol-3-phosphate dehydrogenase [NAD(P)+] n=1 Tax=Candidatus Enterocloster faecavium TaxID=2838560 RepID=A0A9D2RIW1_9FIRM|nr:NAD(P)-dependent glycerol-3-phosphate dehydrogenase [Candidatus Enterocloster faecavium]